MTKKRIDELKALVTGSTASTMNTDELLELIFAAKELEKVKTRPCNNWCKGIELGDGNHSGCACDCPACEEAHKEKQRLFDLVRYQRAELHHADLISEDEYTMLLSDDKSKARLETYDAMRKEIAELKRDKERLGGLLTRASATLKNSAGVHWALHSAKGSVHNKADETCRAVAKQIDAAIKEDAK